MKTDISSRHHILRYILISELNMSVDDINRLTEREINILLVIHHEVSKVRKEKEEDMMK